GMNTGLQAAHNLALLLADVRQRRLSTAALDRYEQERRPVAVMLVKVTDRLFGFIGRRNRRTALLRRRVSGIGAHLAPRLLSTRFGRRIGGGPGPHPHPPPRPPAPARGRPRPAGGLWAPACPRQSRPAAHPGLAPAPLRQPGRAAGPARLDRGSASLPRRPGGPVAG